MRLPYRFAAALLALLVLSLAAAAQPPRTIPGNDNIAQAKTLKFNKPVVVTGVEMASIEVDEPEVVCDNGDAHSLWFRVDIPVDGQIDIYTYGTQMTVMGAHQPRVDQRVVISTYTESFLNPGTLDETACEPRGIDLYQPTNLIGLGVSKDFPVYIRVALDAADEVLAPSQLRIQVQLYGSSLLKNSAFFEGLSGWKVVNGSVDTVVDDDPEINGGNPAFKFTGNPGQNATLKQTVKLGGLRFGQATTLDIAVIYAHDLTGFEFVTKIKVFYKNGTSQTFTYRETATFPDLNPNSGWIAWYPLKSGKIDRIQVSIPFTETSGTLVISGVELSVATIAPSRQ